MLTEHRGLVEKQSLHHSHHLQMVGGRLGHHGEDGALILPAEMSRHPCPMLFGLSEVPITTPALGAQHRLAGWQRVAAPACQVGHGGVAQT